MLKGAHDSLIYCKAQSTIVTHSSFVPFINLLQSVNLISQLFNTTIFNDWKKWMKPICPINEPWVELSEDNDVHWEPQQNDKYTGPNGGPKAGPTQYILYNAHRWMPLTNVFFDICFPHSSTKFETWHTSIVMKTAYRSMNKMIAMVMWRRRRYLCPAMLMLPTSATVTKKIDLRIEPSKLPVASR